MESHSVVTQPREISRDESAYWQPISTTGLAVFIAASAWLMVLLATDKDGFLQIVDSFNLVVHEFGHPFFGVFGDTAGLWGGTIAQLLLPAIIAGVFWFQRSALSMCFAGVWFFENFLNVARYMADARAQELPLVGGGEHDWWHIFTRLGLIENDTAIASFVRTTGWIGMVAFALLAIVIWSRQSGGDRPERPIR